MVHSESIRRILATYLSWMSPSLALAMAAALVAALVYAVVAARPLKYVPCYWALALVGLAAGQVVAQDRLRWLPVGTLALGTGLVVCAALFVALHVLTLWYTEAHRTRTP